LERDQAIEAVAERILGVRLPHPVRVGIDGVSASGKTTLADELAVVLEAQRRTVIRATVDDFHNPPEVRYRRGRLSSAGYYLDAFDYLSLRSRLLDPLGPSGTRRYRVGSYGQPDGSDVEFNEQVAQDDTILIVDGVFLFRPELNDCWDYRVFIEVDQGVVLEHGLRRDAAWMGSPDEARERYENRYVPGERLYLESVRPWALADVIVGNDVPESPEVRFRA
jgi:uridine kinase